MKSTRFSRNVMTLMAGNIIAQAIPIAISPILTRIYSPDDFGVFALYVSFSVILSSIATARYELAVMLPKNDNDAFSLVVLSVLIALLMSVVIFLILYIFNLQIVDYLNNKDISNWLFFVPITVFLTGIYQSLYYWNLRNKNFKVVSVSNVTQGIGASSSNVLYGFSGFGYLGLVSGGITGLLLAVGILIKRFFNKKHTYNFNISVSKIFLMGGKYSKFPKYDMPSTVAYSIYNNFTIIFLSKFFESTVVGMYFFAQRILKKPFMFFVSAYSDAFYQKISVNQDKSYISNEINSYSDKVIKITFIPFFLMVYLSIYYVVFMFGDEWKDLYKYLYVISTNIYLSILMSPYTHVLKVINKQEVSLYGNMLKLSGMAAFAISYFFIRYDPLEFVLYMIVIDTIINLLIATYTNLLIGNKFNVIFKYTLVQMITITFVYYLIF
jgi:O-antigen/teichoic acid export membrane protein